MIIWYFQQHTNRASDDRPPHHLPLLSRRRRNCSCLSFEKHICQLVSILCRNSSIIDILQYTWDWLIKLKLKQERVKILTLEAVLNVTNSNSGLEEPFGKINMLKWIETKKKLKWLLILTVNPEGSTIVSVATLASAFCCAFGWEREISCACLGCLGWSLEL